MNTKEAEGDHDRLPLGPEGALHIISIMANNSYALKHQADSLVANVRGRHARVAATPTARTHLRLANILSLVTPGPKLNFPLTARMVAASGRIRCTFNGAPLSHSDEG